MDTVTVALYETAARRYEAGRTAAFADRATALAARADGPGARLDLGCGPGWYGPLLASREGPAGGPPVVALDAARAMLDLVPAHAPAAPRVRADLAHLPFRRGGAGAAWAAKSYQHLARAELPLALWDLHRVLAVRAPVELILFEGTGDRRLADDDLGTAGGAPTRLFAGWNDEELADVVHGAGFVDVEVERRGAALLARGVRDRTLADTVGPGMRLLLVGMNPSIYSADAGFGFARPGNRFWPALHAAGVHTGPRDPALLARRHGIGMTDLVKRATRRADELKPAELTAGLARIERLARRLEPGAVCFLGLTSWRAATGGKATAGWQDRTVGGRPAYVMPNPSGLNAHATVASLADHLRVAWAGP